MKVDLSLLKRIQEGISQERTGSPDLFAEKLEISRRHLYVNIDYLKSEFDAPIVYSRARETFYFTEEWEFYVGDLSRIKIRLSKVILESINKNLSAM
ncbi:hypothetical protein SAMN04488023_14218 [Pedobacter rhizosphaerae]|uniref:HTH domain-containing protein n=1 Tax=Pedobacter rhizosphaerae TaxID=390241 RepID=A0A1H9VEW9_9SPHI|nr:hypothetical protein SAMN04488023_14218 [Pedobacter rhizosphaerae]